MKQYQRLAVWQHAHELTVGVLRATDESHSPRCRQLFDQLRRAAISVEANVVEGYALSSTPQFRRHLAIALGSAAEVECLLRIAGELEYLPETRLAELAAVVDRTIAVTYGLLKKSRRKT